MAIPPRVHFCWIGPALPWAYVFAVLSAAERGGVPEVILHHTDALEEGAGLRALARAPRVRLSRVDPAACLEQAGRELGLGEALVSLYHRLESPVMRSDILRAAILRRQGGVYLDLDTITVASLVPLLAGRQFISTEFTVWPPYVRASRSPSVLARPVALDLARKLLRRVPRGWAMFRRIEGYCFRTATNAAMGAEPGAPVLADYLRAMPGVPSGGKPQPYALGPDLLQEVVARYRGDDLILQEPRVFYPLPPQISEHWFRIGRDIRLEAVLAGGTRVAHWYASIRTRPEVARIGPDYVRERRRTQLYSALVHACLGDALALDGSEG